MNKTPSRVVALTLVSFLLIVQSIPAQEIHKVRPDADTRIHEIINNRKSEHWDFEETQLELTPPPNARPVRSLPEWASAGAVMFALDSRFLYSLMANVTAGTELKENQLKHRDRKIAMNALFLDIKKQYGIDNEEELFRLLEFSHVFLNILESVAKHVRVIVLIPSEPSRENYLYRFVDYIRKFPGGVELLNSPNLKFIQIPVNTIWLRDYGPIFVRDANNHIICVDSRYHTSRESLEEKQSRERAEQLLEAMKVILYAQLPKSKGDEAGKQNESNLEGRLLDDISPSILAARLRQQKGRSLSAYPLSVVRPPLALSGGDFMTDGRGNGFTSTSTLALNGGSIDSVNLLFKEYFGVNKMLYLQPLPGSTVKHIDMFFKVVSPEIILIGKYETKGNNPTISPLQAEAQKTLDYNLRLLKSFYQRKGKAVNVISNGFSGIQKGKVNIICIPMPDLSRPKLERLNKLNDEISGLVKNIESSWSLQEIVISFDTLEKYMKELADLNKKLTLASKDLESEGEEAPADLQEIARDASRVKAIINYLKQEYENKLRIRDWSVLVSRVDKVINYPNKNVAPHRNLGDKDDETLASCLKDLLGVIKLLTNQVDIYAENFAKQLDNQEFSILTKKTKQKAALESELLNGSDIYRTFLNSLFIKTRNAKLLLVPVYEGLDTMQQEVQELFRKVYSSKYGNISIIPIDSDYLIQMSGTIHCLTQTIPGDVYLLPDDWDYKSNLKKK